MQLNIKQRFAVLTIYLLLILGIGHYFTKEWQFVIDTNNYLNPLLIVTGLALVLGVYITEPHFSKPVDVFTRWIAILLFLIGMNSKECLSLYHFWIGASFFFIFASLGLILLHGFSKLEKFQRIAVDFICKISRPEIVFSLLYFDIVISFFRYRPLEYPILIGFGFLMAINKPIVWFVKFISSIINYFFVKGESGEFLGQVIGHESTDLYKVEIDVNNIYRQQVLNGKLVYLENIKNGIVGIVLSERILLGKKWIQVLSLRDVNQNLISFDLKSLKPLSNEKSIFTKTNAVYILNAESLEETTKERIELNSTNANFKNLVGCVWEGSSINKIRFNKLFSGQLQKDNSIGEGTIVETVISNEKVLYQIIDGRTDEESLEHKDTYGFTIGVAQKLGKYDLEKHELNSAKWLPEIYTPIFLLDKSSNTEEYVPMDNIGRLPNTNYGIPILKPNDLVTHNTAILGILGIGKSCLTFELLKKIIDTTTVKVFCIDLTYQYAKELPHYVSPSIVQEDFLPAVKTEITDAIKIGNADNSNTWGNINEYKAILDRELASFIASESRILTLNPDLHKVEKANAEFKITHNEPITAAQKTRIIAERIFMKAQALGETKDARYLIVFEEAHSLIPEWNSVSNDGDKNATNGTAKVILQGRKYGLGSFVITQRTANISKSVLNQCNTIFALRIFDDTGKQFLENYIGSDYSNLLPTLEERHCIAIGKALNLKQPIILQLNDSKDIIIPV